MTQVLLVETDHQHREELKSLLQSNGFSVLESMPTDLDELELSSFDCMVAGADLLPPPNDILSHTSATPTVLVDHQGDARQAVAAMKHGASDYIVAPFDPDELVDWACRRASTLRLLADAADAGAAM